MGSVSQGAANAVLQGYEGYEVGMGMFDMSVAMVPAAIVQIIWWGTIGYNMLIWVLKPDSPGFDKNNAFSVANFSGNINDQKEIPAWKGTLSIVTLLICIALFFLSGVAPFSSKLDIAIVALLGATFLFVTGTVPVKESLANLPWDVLVCIGTISALGTALDVSGGGQVLADAVLAPFGGQNASIPVVTAVICLLCSALTLFMQNSGVAAMITPVVIPMAMSLGSARCPGSRCGRRHQPGHCHPHRHRRQHADSPRRLYLQGLRPAGRASVADHDDCGHCLQCALPALTPLPHFSLLPPWLTAPMWARAALFFRSLRCGTSPPYRPGKETTCWTPFSMPSTPLPPCFF